MFALTQDGRRADYWNLPELQIPNNSRAGSASVHFAIIAKYSGCPFLAGEPTKPLFALIREPFSRYQSAKSKGANEYLLGNHFEPQVRLLRKGARLYRFPEHLPQFGQDTGLGAIPWSNRTLTCAAPLTDEEAHQVQIQFAEDFRVHQSIAHAGQLYAG